MPGRFYVSHRLVADTTSAIIAPPTPPRLWHIHVFISRHRRYRPDYFSLSLAIIMCRFLSQIRRRWEVLAMNGSTFATRVSWRGTRKLLIVSSGESSFLDYNASIYQWAVVFFSWDISAIWPKLLKIVFFIFGSFSKTGKGHYDRTDSSFFRSFQKYSVEDWKKTLRKRPSVEEPHRQWRWRRGAKIFCER